MTTYSRYWRKNRSRHEATELALGLRALRKVAGHIGRNVKPIYWSGMVNEDNRSILLDTDRITGSYPISPKNFDILVGKVALEGLASTEWTDWVKETTAKTVSDLPENVKPYIEAFVDAAEDIYIHELASPHVWSLYLSNLWEDSLFIETRDPTLPPSPDSLADMWRRKALLDNLPDSLHYHYDDLMALLNNFSGSLKEVTSLPSLRERREKRVDLYREICSHIHRIISEWEEFEVHPDGVNMFDEAGPEGELPEMGDMLEDQQEELQETSELEPYLAEEVRTLVEEGEADLTQDVAVAVQEPEAGTMETVYKLGVARTDVQPDEYQVRRLKKIFRDQEALIRRSRRKHMRRGLKEGKLDPRRLYRVPLDGTVFKNRQAPSPEFFWQICIVADASASMAGKGGLDNPWHIAEKTFVSLAEAAKGFRNLLHIYGYNAERNLCNLIRLLHGGELYSLMPAGRTPSGQAIVGAALGLQEKLRKSMIIHITDGAANCGLRLRDAVTYCHSNNIEVFTIGCGCTRQTRDFLRESFPPGCVYFMKDINYLSVGLEHLFKRRILNRSTAASR